MKENSFNLGGNYEKISSISFIMCNGIFNDCMWKQG